MSENKSLIVRPNFERRCTILYIRITTAVILFLCIIDKKVAEKFAHDSGSALGRIKTATQGQFSITDEEGDNSRKVVRVVSTVTYFLND